MVSKYLNATSQKPNYGLETRFDLENRRSELLLSDINGLNDLFIFFSSRNCFACEKVKNEIENFLTSQSDNYKISKVFYFHNISYEESPELFAKFFIIAVPIIFLRINNLWYKMIDLNQEGIYDSLYKNKNLETLKWYSPLRCSITSFLLSLIFKIISSIYILFFFILLIAAFSFFIILLITRNTYKDSRKFSTSQF